NIPQNTRTIVIDFEHDRFLLAVVPRADDQNAAAVGGEHRLLGVDDQVQQYLLKLMTVGVDLWQTGGEGVEDSDVRHALFVGAQREGFTNDVIDAHKCTRGLALAGERQEVAYDARRPLGFTKDRFQATSNGVVGRRALNEPLGPAQDRGERVVQFVGDT